MQDTLRPGLVVREATIPDAFSLGPRLRDADRAEIDAVNGDDPESILAHGVLQGRECLTLEWEGKPIAMFGTVDFPTRMDVGIVWLLGSPEIEDVGFSFLRASRRYLDKLTAPYDYVTNCVHKDNELHLKWLAWLGCQKVDEHLDYGRNGETFIEFIYPSLSPN